MPYKRLPPSEGPTDHIINSDREMILWTIFLLTFGWFGLGMNLLLLAYLWDDWETRKIKNKKNE